jgi:hypothetical protein
VKLEEIIAAILLAEEEDGDLLVSCVSEVETDILKQRKAAECYSSFTGRWLMGSGDEIQRIFQTLERHFPIY